MTTAIDWTAIVVGDPDPTVGHFVLDEDRCPEFNWAAERHMVWCTRDRHDGRHVAGDGHTVLAVW